jgi:hypothetical protein
MAGNQEEKVKRLIREGADMKEINKAYADYAANMQGGGHKVKPLSDFTR